MFWNQEGGNHKISLVLCEQVVIIGEWVKMDRWTHHCNSSVKLGSVSLFSKPNKKEILNISLPPTTYCAKVMFSVCLSNCPHPTPVQTCLLCSLYIYWQAGSYHPQMKLREGNVFTCAHHSVHGGGDMMSHPVWSHVPSRGGNGGYGPWGGGMVREEGYGSRGGNSIPYPPVLTSSGSHWSRRYASYWNACLLFMYFKFSHSHWRILSTQFFSMSWDPNFVRLTSPFRKFWISHWFWAVVKRSCTGTWNTCKRGTENNL